MGYTIDLLQTHIRSFENRIKVSDESLKLWQKSKDKDAKKMINTIKENLIFYKKTITELKADIAKL